MGLAVIITLLNQVPSTALPKEKIILPSLKRTHYHILKWHKLRLRREFPNGAQMEITVYLITDFLLFSSLGNSFQLHHFPPSSLSCATHCQTDSFFLWLLLSYLLCVHVCTHTYTICVYVHFNQLFIFLLLTFFSFYSCHIAEMITIRVR